MQNTRNAGLAGKVALVVLALAAARHSLPAQTEIRFHLVNDNLIVASLKCDQEGPFEFVLDTGADTTVIDPSIAAKLGFVPLDRIRQTTLAGVQVVTRGSIRNLAAGPFAADHVVVLVQDLSGLRRLDPDIRGIAGQNFLSHFNYLLDYRRHVMRFEQGSEIRDAVDGEHVPMDGSENRMLIDLQAQSQSHAKLQLMLDSGASSIVLLGRAAQALGLPLQATVAELTSNGPMEVQKGRIKEIAVGSQLLRNVGATVTKVRPAEQVGDGLLPTALFQTLYVNNRESFVVFNPRSKGSTRN